LKALPFRVTLGVTETFIYKLYNELYMARPTKLVDTKISTINLQKSDILFMSENGFNRSEFVRQAVLAMKDNKWEYIR
jgi:hypothetical protein